MSNEDDDLIPDRPLHELSDREILILMCDRQGTMNKRVNNLHGRVVSLENWRTFLAGAWTVVTGVGGYLIHRKSV